MQGAPPLGQALFRHLDECEACQRPHWSCPEYWAIIREFRPDPVELEPWPIHSECVPT